MALHIAYSNSYDVLKAQLTVNLTTDSQSGTDLLFSPIQIVVPSREIENDIARSLCQTDGICIGFSFSNLAGWLKPYGSFWHTSSIDNFTLPWSLYPILTRIQKENNVHSDYGRLVEHLKGMTPGELFSLAEHIARVFTKYVNYRYDWVCSWIGDPNATIDTDKLDTLPDLPWQKRLWQELRSRDKAKEEPSSIYATSSYTGKILALQEQLLGDSAEEKPLETKTTPVHIFLPHTLPPLAMPVLAKQAQERDVWLYVFNPCCRYWFNPGDAVPKDLFHWTENTHMAEQNRLLRENARSIRAFIDRLWQYAPDEGMSASKLIEDNFSRGKRDLKGMRRLWEQASASIYAKVADTDQSFIWQKRQPQDGKPLTLLDAVVNSILFDCPLSGDESDFSFDAKAFSATRDTSLRIFKSQGQIGEIEAVIDWIEALKQAHGYSADDFLVVTPNVSNIAGLVRGVINARASENRIAYKILGEVSSQESAVLQSGTFFFTTPDFDTFFELISSPLFMRCWDIDYTDLQTLRNWLVAAGFRNGICQAHLRALLGDGAVEDDDTTLGRAIERLALGFAYPQGTEAVHGRSLAIFGNEVQGHENETVSEQQDLFCRLLSLWQTLKSLAQLAHFELDLYTGLTAAEWKTFSEALLDGLYPNKPESFVTDARESFTQAVETLHETILRTTQEPDERIAPAVYWASLKRAVGVSVLQSRQEGAVTFANMDALRNIPFKAVAMIGLGEDSDFPGNTTSEEFDLTCAYRNDSKALPPRRGDQDSRIDNRSLFLELICSVKRHLLITYDAGKIAGEKSKNACAVVEDFAQWLDEQAPGILMKISGTLPASRLSEDSFTVSCDKSGNIDGIRFFTNRNPNDFAAWKDSAGTVDPPDHPEDYLRGFSPEPESTPDVLYWKDLLQAWINPTGYIHGKLKLTFFRDIPELTEPVGLYPNLAADPLQKKMLTKRFLETLQSGDCEGVTDDQLVTYLCQAECFRLNPSYGFATLRPLVLEALAREAVSILRAQQTLAPTGPVREDPGYLIIDKTQIRLPILDVIPKDSSQPTTDFLFTALSNSDYVRAALLQIALKALDNGKDNKKNYRLRLLGIAKEANGAQELPGPIDEIKDPDVRTLLPFEAFSVMTSLVRLTEAMNTNIRVLQTKTSNQSWGDSLPPFNPVWRGFETWQDNVMKEKVRLDGLCIFKPQEEASKKAKEVNAVDEFCHTITRIIHKGSV